MADEQNTNDRKDDQHIPAEGENEKPRGKKKISFKKSNQTGAQNNDADNVTENGTSDDTSEAAGASSGESPSGGASGAGKPKPNIRKKAGPKAKSEASSEAQGTEQGQTPAQSQSDEQGETGPKESSPETSRSSDTAALPPSEESTTASEASEPTSPSPEGAEGDKKLSLRNKSHKKQSEPNKKEKAEAGSAKGEEEKASASQEQAETQSEDSATASTSKKSRLSLQRGADDKRPGAEEAEEENSEGRRQMPPQNTEEEKPSPGIIAGILTTLLFIGASALVFKPFWTQAFDDPTMLSPTILAITAVSIVVVAVCAIGPRCLRGIGAILLLLCSIITLYMLFSPLVPDQMPRIPKQITANAAQPNFIFTAALLQLSAFFLLAAAGSWRIPIVILLIAGAGISPFMALAPYLETPEQDQSDGASAGAWEMPIILPGTWEKTDATDKADTKTFKSSDYPFTITVIQGPEASGNTLKDYREKRIADLKSNKDASNLILSKKAFPDRADTIGFRARKMNAYQIEEIILKEAKHLYAVSFSGDAGTLDEYRSDIRSLYNKF